LLWYKVNMINKTRILIESLIGMQSDMFDRLGELEKDMAEFMGMCEIDEEGYTLDEDIEIEDIEIEDDVSDSLDRIEYKLEKILFKLNKK